MNLDHLVIVKRTSAGPELHIGDVLVRDWLGTSFNEDADILAGEIRAAILNYLNGRDSLTGQSKGP